MGSLYTTLFTPVASASTPLGRTEGAKAPETVDKTQIDVFPGWHGPARRVGRTIETFAKETVDNDREADGWSLLDYERT